MTPSIDTPIRRAVRRFTLGSGPLKRGSDRVQMVGRLVVLLAFVAAPPLAVAAAAATTAHFDAIATAQAAERHRSVALLLEDAAAPSGSIPHDAAVERDMQTRARWPAPDGTLREGIVLVPPGTRAGTSVPVWMDGDGDLTSAPLDPHGIPGSAMTVAALLLIGVPAVTWTLYGVLCAALDAHRQRRWASGWAAVAPEWGPPEWGPRPQ